MVDERESLLFQWSEVGFDIDGFRQSVSTNHTACIRGLVTQDRARQARDYLMNNINPEEDEIHDPSNHMRMANYLQKRVESGSYKQSSKHFSPTGRNLRMLINPMWDEDRLGMHDIFEQLIDFRNLLYGKEKGFAKFGVSDEMWTASRVHHYEVGKGFMDVHSDKVLSSVSRESGLDNYFQIVLLLSEKPGDFVEGGGYAMIGNRDIILEDEFEIGDVVVYDGSIPHGVKLIGSNNPSHHNQLSGRFAAFVSLYKDLGGMKEYVDSLDHDAGSLRTPQ